MNKDKECLCGSIKRREQHLCDECHENFYKCKTSTERMEYFLKKVRDNANEPEEKVKIPSENFTLKYV